MRYRDRRQATAYLRENGIPCGDHFLAHLAVDGTGPEFRYSGRHPIYTEEALDAWVEVPTQRTSAFAIAAAQYTVRGGSWSTNT